MPNTVDVRREIVFRGVYLVPRFTHTTWQEELEQQVGQTMTKKTDPRSTSLLKVQQQIDCSRQRGFSSLRASLDTPPHPL